MKYLLWILQALILIKSIKCCLNYKREYLVKYPHISALVLARGGSQGIKLKNIQKVYNKTLLGRSLEQIKQVHFDSVWVSTDSYLIAEEAEKYGVNIHWRSPKTATNQASSLLAIQEFLKNHLEVDIVALVQCTSPFLKKIFLEEAIELAKTHECVFSVSRSTKFIWKVSEGKLKPINFNPEKRPRRQDFDAYFVENGMFYIAARNLVKKGYLQSKRYLYIPCSFCGSSYPERIMSCACAVLCEPCTYFLKTRQGDVHTAVCVKCKGGYTRNFIAEELRLCFTTILETWRGMAPNETPHQPPDDVRQNATIEISDDEDDED